MNDFTITFAASEDKPSIKHLLSASGLPDEDVTRHLHHFLLARRGHHIAGVVGLEVCGQAGLLRSLAVAPPYQGQGLGKKLCENITAHARLQNIEELYLLTTTAESFFSRLGFVKVERRQTPAPIQATREFRSLCPSSAVCMMKRIAEEVQYFPREILRLQPDIPGARMWRVALKKAMLTYFEIQAHSRFETHHHESEQITVVLQGELFFEVSGKIIRVREGEVIAIPAGVLHAVFTQKRTARAVDAWSPPLKKLIK